MGTRSSNPLWKNGSTGGTPINANALNNIENALDTAIYPDNDGLLPESQVPTRLTEASLKSTFASASVVGRLGATLPLPSVADHNMWPKSASDGVAAAQNSRVMHTVFRDISEASLAYVNTYGSESTSGLGTITITAGIELPDASVIRVTFNGQISVSIPPGCIAVSDPVPLYLTAGQVLRSRTYMTVASGNRFPLGFNGVTFGTSGEGGERGTSVTDMSISGTIPVTGSVSLFGPVAVIGRPTEGPFLHRSYGIVGDSIAYGQGDLNAPLGGYLHQALNHTRSVLNVALIGERASTLTTLANRAVRMKLLQGCSTVYGDYGVNDLILGASADTLKANYMTLWAALSRIALGVRWMTLTPKTSTTDGWMTEANQTAATWESVRADVNAWLRDGAPILNGAAAATGSSAAGTLRAGDVGHYLAGIDDVAANVEAIGGKWREDSARREVPGITVAAGASRIVSATPQFSGADVGKCILIPGAGTSGATWTVRIYAVDSTTEVRTAGGTGGTAGTAVSSVTAVVGDVLTDDGTHPSILGHAAMAPAVTVV